MRVSFAQKAIETTKRSFPSAIPQWPASILVNQHLLCRPIHASHIV